MTQVIGKMTEEFCPHGSGPVNPSITERDVVIVSDYLDVSSYSPGLAGVVLGEVTRSSLSKVCGHKVRQVDLGKSLRLNSEGLVALTRDASKVANPEFGSRWGYIGTFAELPGKLVLALRELDMESGTTTKLVTREIVFGCKFESGKYNFEYSFN
jgi:hypothetical protein